MKVAIRCALAVSLGWSGAGLAKAEGPEAELVGHRSNCNCQQAPCCPPVTAPPADSVPMTSVGPADPVTESPEYASPPPQTPTTSGSALQDLLSLGLSRGNYLTSSISPSGAGLGTATAMGMLNGAGGTLDPNVTFDSVSPLISPGLLTSANGESPYITDRIFFSYSYYNAFQVAVPASAADTVSPGVAEARDASFRANGFDLHRYDVGFEKSLCEDVSVYLRAPFLNATDNIFDIPINGAGNLNVGLKFQLYHNRCTDNIVSAGFTVAAPTSRDGQFVSTKQFNLTGLDAGEVSTPDTIAVQSVTEINPTFLQPWIGGQLNGDCAFVQTFFGFLIPTDDRVVTSLNANVTIGSVLYENPCANCITSITPVLNFQFLTPFDGDGKLLDYPDQVFLTPGMQVGLGRHVALGAGVSTPIAGPRGYDVGANVGLNFFR